MVSYNCEDVPELDLPSSLVDQEYHVTVKAGDHLYTLSKQGVCIFNSKNLNWQYFCHCKFSIIISLLHCFWSARSRRPLISVFHIVSLLWDSTYYLILSYSFFSDEYLMAQVKGSYFLK